MMLANWQLLLQKFAALSGRERLLILVAIFAVAWQVADIVVFERQFRQAGQLNAGITRDNNAIITINGQINALTSSASNDPNNVLRQQIDQVRADILRSREGLQTASSELISPQDMSRFLEQLLVQERELTLQRLNTLAAAPLLPVDASSDADEGRPKNNHEPVLHRHGFEIEFSGGYLATLRFLQSLEALPWQFFWDSVDYEVIDYPNSRVRLKLHTLSLSEDWIGV